jgi:hypothetical protein
MIRRGANPAIGSAFARRGVGALLLVFCGCTSFAESRIDSE